MATLANHALAGSIGVWLAALVAPQALSWIVGLGMMVANIPAVIVGETLAHRVPMKAVRWLAATLFVAAGLATLIGAGQPPANP